MNAMRRVTLVAESSSQALHPERRPSVRRVLIWRQCVTPAGDAASTITLTPTTRESCPLCRTIAWLPEEETMSRIVFASLIAGLLALLTPSAATAGYPEKPIRLVVPFAPGGGTDLLCRALQDKMDRALGVSVIIDNRAGAGGTIGVTLAARAVPD